MTDWRIRLRDADRALTPDVQPETSQRMRRTVLAAVPADGRAVRPWSRAFAATAAALTLICVGLLTSLRSERVTDDSAAQAPSTDPSLISATDGIPATARQQLQFATPGGTRIIWVFDSGFEVKGTLP
jgi:hypothetical protein